LFKRRDAFSLAEVSLALGIVGFMMVPIMSLLTIAQRGIGDSTAESRASLVANRIFAGMSRSNERTGVLIETTSNPELHSGFQSFSIADLSGQSSVTLLYTEGGQVIDAVPPDVYESGFRSPLGEGAVMARISLRPLNPPTLRSGSIAMPRGLYKVDVSVESPGAAPQQSRDSHVFTAYLTLGNSTTEVRNATSTDDGGMGGDVDSPAGQ